MSPEEMVQRLRAHAAANPSPFGQRALLSELVELEDEALEPSLAEQCRPCRACGWCGDPCAVCGDPIMRFASSWWHCHGRRDHYARPAVKEKP